MTSGAERPWQARLPFFYGWIIVGLGFISALFGIGLTWAAGLFAVPMHADLGWSRSSIFFAISLRGWIGIAVAPFIGRYIDRPNGARVLAVAGGLLNTLALLLIARMTAQWQFILLFGVVGGGAQSVQSFLSVAVVPKWFIRQRGLAVSISTVGGGLAAFIMPAVINGLSAAAGWRGAWALLGVCALVLGTIPSLLIQRQPEDVGLLPDGEAAIEAAARASARRAAEPAFTLRDAVHTPAFWLLIAGVAIGGLSANGIPSNIAAIFVDRGFSFATAGVALMWYGVASVAAKFAWGWLAKCLRYP
jgi:sugar phosphate permease